mgnify:FL=1
MNIKSLTDVLSVSPQIAIAELPEIKAQGFRSIVCNRPDGEDDGQPSFEEVSAAAKAQGLEMIWQPVVRVSDEDAQVFAKALTDLPTPTLAYCRSGTRCSTLWALSQAASGAMSTDEILAAASAAGYDLSGMAQKLSGQA